MSIINYLKSTLVESIIEDEDVVSSEEPETEQTEDKSSFEGDPKALVDDLIKNAPGMKEQIGTILKYAANSIPNYDIWDAALDYYESLGDEEPVDDEPMDEEPVDEEPMDDEPVDEEPTEEKPMVKKPSPRKEMPVSDDDLAM